MNTQKVFLKEEVDKIFGDVFNEKVPYDELEIFLRKLLLIMKKQVDSIIYMNEVVDDHLLANQSLNCNQFYQFPTLYYNNLFQPMPTAISQNYSQSMICCPPTYSNPYNLNFCMQQIPMLNQQSFIQTSKVSKKDKKKKKDKKNKKDKKSKKDKKKAKDEKEVLKIDFKGDPFSGIFSSLTRKAGGNINDKEIIKISGNRDTKPNEHFYGTLSTIVDFNHSNRCFKSSSDPNSYICFDFVDHKISVSAYTIKSSNLMGPSCLLSWVLEGSEDSFNWETLDTHSNEKCLISESDRRPSIQTFTVQKNDKKPFKFIRLRMTGRSNHGDYCFGLTNMEFFGKYY